MPRFSSEYLAQLLMEDAGHYLLFSFIFMGWVRPLLPFGLPVAAPVRRVTDPLSSLSSSPSMVPLLSLSALAALAMASFLKQLVIATGTGARFLGLLQRLLNMSPRVRASSRPCATPVPSATAECSAARAALTRYSFHV